MKHRAWISEILIEFVMMFLSILLALWVSNWQQDQSDKQLIVQSLQNFLKEIQQNQNRLDDAVPYHKGLDTALKEMIASRALRTRDDLFQMVGLDGVRPPFLLETAWQTALATGALSHMDYQTVSALSLTYTLQSRFRDDGRQDLPAVLRTGDLGGETAPAAARGVATYLDEVTASENELRAVYAQAEVVVRQKLEAMGAAPDSTGTASDSAGAAPDSQPQPRPSP